MSRTPAYLAAVASSAVPGLDPVAVRAVRPAPGNRCDVGFVTDSQRRAWTVRVPSTPAVGAQLDAAAALLPLLSRRLPFGVPSPRGFARVAEGRAVVYPYLHGRSVVLAEIPSGPGLAAEVGKAVAALHNLDRAVFEEAGVPAYDAESCRIRHLADLDRAAATRHVPTALLSRWEQALEDVPMWRFAPTPTHGDLHGGRLLVSFTDEDDSDTVSVRAVTGWEYAKVADPADDLAALAADCAAAAFESVVEAYALARLERPDVHLRLRARLLSELRLMMQLLEAVTAADAARVARRTAELRALDQRVAHEPALAIRPRPSAPPGYRPAGRAAGAPSPSEALPPAAQSDPSPGPSQRASEQAPEQASEHADDHTQPLRVGAGVEATTVIPHEELDQVRGAEAAAGAAAHRREVAGGAAEAETTDSEAAGSETAEAETAEAQTAEAQTAEAQTAEAQTAEAQTADSTPQGETAGPPPR